MPCPGPTTPNIHPPPHAAPPALPAAAAAVFAVTLAALFLLLLAAFALPGGPVRANIARSVPLLQQEGLYPELFGFKLFQMDNYTDTIMLFEAAAADEADPLTAMMTATAYNVDNFETLPDDLQTYLDARDRGACRADTGLEPFLLRAVLARLPDLAAPAFAGFDLRAGAGGQLHRVFAADRRAALAAVEGLRPLAGGVVRRQPAGGVGLFLHPARCSFLPCFAIGYAACLWVLAKPAPPVRWPWGWWRWGVCTSFLDLLVTPILTLGLPLTVWLLDPRVPGSRAPLRRCGAVAGGAVCWGAGYALCWASKWVLAGLVHRAEHCGRRAAPGGGAHLGGYLARHGADLGQYLPLCLRYIEQPRAVLAADRRGAGVRGAVCAVPAQPAGALRGAAAAAGGAVRPGLAGTAAHTIPSSTGGSPGAAWASRVFAGLAFVHRACSLSAARQRLRRKKGLTAGGRRRESTAALRQRALHPFREYDILRYQM